MFVLTFIKNVCSDLFFECLFWPCSLPRLPISRVIGCRKTLQHVLEPPFNLNVLHQNKHLSHLLIYNFSKSRFQCDALAQLCYFGEVEKDRFANWKAWGHQEGWTFAQTDNFKRFSLFEVIRGEFPKNRIHMELLWWRAKDAGLYVNKLTF